MSKINTDEVDQYRLSRLVQPTQLGWIIDECILPAGRFGVCGICVVPASRMALHVLLALVLLTGFCLVSQKHRRTSS